MTDIGRELDEKQWVLLQKICIVDRLVDEIERMYPWSTENLESVRHFKTVSGHTQKFRDAWGDALGGLLEHQHVLIEEMMSAEMANELNRHAHLVRIADILQKPEEDMTAEETEIIVAHVTPKKRPTVEDDGRKGIPKAAPAVLRPIAKVRPANPQFRPTYVSRWSSGQTV